MRKRLQVIQRLAHEAVTGIFDEPTIPDAQVKPETRTSDVVSIKPHTISASEPWTTADAWVLIPNDGA
jgi:hypothetical protein